MSEHAQIGREQPQQAVDDVSLSSEVIVDADVHIGRGIESDDIAYYLDEPHRSTFLHGSHGAFPTTNWDRELGGKIHHNSFSDADELDAQLCAGFGVDYPILNTMNGLNKLPQADFAVNLMRAYNDVLLNKFLDEKDHFKGLITIGTQDPERSAEEIDRLADERQFVGIYIATGGPMYPLGDPRYDVIYKTAEDNDLAVVYHGHAGSFNTDFTRQNQAISNFFTVHPLAHAWDQMLTVASLLGNGTPEKFPDLDFVFLEAGIGWVPYMMFRYNKEYSIRRMEVPLLKKSPEQYIREQFYFGTQPMEEPENPEDLRRIIETVGPESILFSTDYPHWDFDNPEAVSNLYATYFSTDERKRVFNENAAEVFGLDL